MTVPFQQPDHTSDSGAQYKTNLDNATAVQARTSAWFHVQAQDTPDMTVRVGSGPVLTGVTLSEIAAQNTGTITAPSTNNRIDRVVIDTTGTVTVVTGTEASSPVAPSIPDGNVPLAQILLTPSTTEIANSDITDERALPPRQAPTTPRATAITLTRTSADAYSGDFGGDFNVGDIAWVKASEQNTTATPTIENTGGAPSGAKTVYKPQGGPLLPSEFRGVRSISLEPYHVEQVGNPFSFTCESPALAALSATTIAVVDETTGDLEHYTWDGSDWSQDGNALTISGITGPHICALDANTIAFIDYGNNDLRTYSWNGTNWSLTGSELNITGPTRPTISKMSGDGSSASICWWDQGNGHVRKYDWNGSSWSQDGSSFSPTDPPNYAAICGMNSTDAALWGFGSNSTLRMLRFSGGSWSEVGNRITEGYLARLFEPFAESISDTVIVAGGQDTEGFWFWEFIDDTDWVVVGNAPGNVTGNHPNPVNGSRAKVAVLDSETLAFVDDELEQILTYDYSPKFICNDPAIVHIIERKELTGDWDANQFCTIERLGNRVTVQIDYQATHASSSSGVPATDGDFLPWWSVDRDAAENSWELNDVVFYDDSLDVVTLRVIPQTRALNLQYRTADTGVNVSGRVGISTVPVISWLLRDGLL